VSKAAYINERVRRVAGLTRDQAIGTAVPDKNGNEALYTASDLKYDQQHGYLEVPAA
jgi:hypothetical protein